MSRRLVDILTELDLDDEFARRFGLGAPSSAPLVRYFTERGVDQAQAQFLAMAYLVGARHTNDHVGRVLDRLEKASKS